MTRTRRLEPVVKFNDRKERQALQAVASSQSELDLDISKLKQLQAYKREYLEKGSDTNSTCSSLQLQEFKRFLAQLDQTIEQQKEIIKMREKELDAKRQSWQARRVDSNKIHKVIENLQQEEEIQLARTEQKVMDELTQFKFQKS